MKIIYLHQYFNTPEMSGGTRSYEMARRMVAAGHEVHMITSFREPNREHSDWFITEESGIQVHWYPVPYSNHMGYWQRIKAFFTFAFAARSKATLLKGDVVFATSTPLTIALPGVFAARKLNVPMVFEVRDLWPEMPIAMGALKNPVFQFLAKKLEHWAYHNSKAVIALSPGMKDGVIKTGYPADQVAVIPNSSDNLEFKYNADAAKQFRVNREWLQNKPLLVYTGTFGKVNGVGYMVELAAALKKRKSDICILLVGSGAEYDSVKQSAIDVGVYQHNLFLEPSLPKKNIPGLLSAATIASNLVTDLPEARANSANKFFDALAAGKPILLNHGGWMHHLVKMNKCGLPLWKKSINEVAEILDVKMHDELWLEKAGLAARQLAEESFDRDKLAGQLMQVLQAVIEGQPEYSQEIAPGNYDQTSF